MRNRGGPTIKPHNTPALKLAQDEHWSFQTTLSFLLLKEIFRSFT